MARRGNGASAHGPGQGDGWGGPARGASVAPQERPRLFDGSLQPSKAHRSIGWDKRKIREERTQELEDMLYDLAVQAEREETRVTAAVKLHAIYNGQPVAPHQHSGPNGEPMQIESVRRVIIDPANLIAAPETDAGQEDYGDTHH